MDSATTAGVLSEPSSFDQGKMSPKEPHNDVHFSPLIGSDHESSGSRHTASLNHNDRTKPNTIDIEPALASSSDEVLISKVPNSLRLVFLPASPLFIVVLLLSISLVHRMAVINSMEGGPGKMRMYKLWLSRDWLLDDLDPGHETPSWPALPNELPFLGSAPWNETYTFDASFNWTVDEFDEFVQFVEPWNATLIPSSSNLTKLFEDEEFPYEADSVNFGIGFNRSLCINVEDNDVSGFYGQGSFIAWLFTAAFTMSRHEQKMFDTILDGKESAPFEIRRMTALDLEVVAFTIYGWIAVGDVWLRAIRRDAGPSTVAALQVVYVFHKISQFNGYFWWGAFYYRWLHDENHRIKHNLRMYNSFFGSGVCLITYILWLTVAGQTRTAWYIFSRIFLVVIEFLYGLGYATAFGSIPSEKDFCTPLGLILTEACLALLSLGENMVIIQLTGRDSIMHPIECNSTFMADIFPTNASTLLDLDQAAVLATVVFAILKGSISRLYIKMRRRPWHLKNNSTTPTTGAFASTAPEPEAVEPSSPIGEEVDWAVVYGSDIELQPITGSDIADTTLDSVAENTGAVHESQSQSHTGPLMSGAIVNKGKGRAIEMC